MSLNGWSAVVSLNKAFIEIWLKTQFLFYLLILTVFLYTCFMNKAEPVPEYTYQTLLLAKYCVINWCKTAHLN